MGDCIYSFNKKKSYDWVQPDCAFPQYIDTFVTNVKINSISENDIEKISIRNSLENIGDSSYPDIDKTKIQIVSDADRKRNDDARENNDKFLSEISDAFNWICEQFQDGATLLERTDSGKKAVRTYDKTAQMPKIVYSKASASGGIVKKIIVFLIVCCCVGTFFGVQSNSYYIFKEGTVSNTMSCALGWIFEADKMKMKLSPFVPEVFFTGFAVGAGILAVLGLFIYLDNESKKRSRVGHEHGSAHLGTGRDFKIFKNKFME